MSNNLDRQCWKDLPEADRVWRQQWITLAATRPLVRLDNGKTGRLTYFGKFSKRVTIHCDGHYLRIDHTRITEILEEP